MKQLQVLFSELLQIFIFGTIVSFTFGAIADFIFTAINLLYDYDEKYLLQIKIRLKKIIIYLEKNYLRYVYLY